MTDYNARFGNTFPVQGIRGCGVQTSVSTDGLIEQQIDILGETHRRILNTAEQQIRDALIALGWTPPSPKPLPTPPAQ